MPSTWEESITQVCSLVELCCLLATIFNALLLRRKRSPDWSMGFVMNCPRPRPIRADNKSTAHAIGKAALCVFGVVVEAVEVAVAAENQRVTYLSTVLTFSSVTPAARSQSCSKASTSPCLRPIKRASSVLVRCPSMNKNRRRCARESFIRSMRCRASSNERPWLGILPDAFCGERSFWRFWLFSVPEPKNALACA